ncbi:MAG: 50S ribosomal protein L17 [Kofleriaceae bacterium]|jgi:large subunit ribosomal protein L17|nr:50S ribosomal protein L17 [Kofleriaceae bacterium]MBP9169048.1 50S ribosomal protein L17 [Kofleriaceae bacterium]MBP9858775.1 50S ribosomal protein L17 [Kofleriaceae bacterium]
MRHGNSGRKLSRTASHRDALYANLVTALFTYGRIETTEAKAKDLRAHADAAIGWGVGVADLLGKGDKATAAEKAKIVHARRQARKVVKTRDALDRLFREIGPHFAKTKKQGGYTRMLKTRFRAGDAASMALVELIGLAPAPVAAA